MPEMGSNAAPGGDGDWVIPQDWDAYSAAEHDIWRRLTARQQVLLPGRAAARFLDHMAELGLAGDGIPDFARLNPILQAATGWTLVGVPGLVPDAVFFRHLAARRFPATRFIRRPEQLDYIEEPDLFHDVFGHVPLLLDRDYGDYLAAYGEAALAAQATGQLHRLARLYWYSVEFGLIETADGLRIFGSGIVSSASESLFCLDDPSPHHLAFDPGRVMRTRYRIDDYQETYFVFPGFDALRQAIGPGLEARLAALEAWPDCPPGAILAGDRVLRRGTGAYHAGHRRNAGSGSGNLYRAEAPRVLGARSGN